MSEYENNLERERDFYRDMAERRHEERNEARARIEALEGALRENCWNCDAPPIDPDRAALAGETEEECYCVARGPEPGHKESDHA